MFRAAIRMGVIVFFTFFVAGSVLAAEANPRVLMKTTLGDMELELYPTKAPVGVKNFLMYVDSGFYDGLIFHRVIPGFMIQGGGFDKDLNKKGTRPPIKNEADNGLKNDRGTLAYARTSVVDSATSQFFINHANNASLNFKNKTRQGYGYAVFGKVTKGLDVLDKIAEVQTGTARGMRDVPKIPVIILSVKQIK